VSAAGAPRAARGLPWGRSFLHPLFDYALIGGGLSLVFAALVALRPASLAAVDATTLALVLLASNAAHFAASSVRLYTLPGASQTWPQLTRVVPLAFLLLLALALTFPAGLGDFLTRLYLSWSPYHYAAQAYGLCVMYCYRSGCALRAGDKAVLRWACLLPFLHNFLTAPGIGLDALLLYAGVGPVAWLVPLREGAAQALKLASVAAPLGLFVALRRGSGAPMPLIAPLVMLANGVWWLVLLPLQAFVWATVFHGIQYLAIAMVFHVRDQRARPGNRRGALPHALTFYALSLALGFALFDLVPEGFVVAGFGKVESVLLVVAAINIHHFVVDAYVWRLRAGSANRRIAESAAAAA
jgi:hypothetical protein